jgi:aminopeptidase YwaD
MKIVHALMCCTLTCSTFPLAAQDLLDAHRRDLLHEALSGERAKDHVLQITRYNRVQASREYRAAAEYVLAELRKAGYDSTEAFIESYPSDGRRTYQTWQSPSGWDITWGELRMVEPSDERIVGYPEIGMSVMPYSNPGDVTAELVWVGAGTSAQDYQNKDVRGKIVLATGYGGDVHRLAVLKYGARAVVCYLDDDRAKRYPDMLQYTGIWPKADELNHVTFGFNITNRQGTYLRALLAAGKKVVLRGQVKGIGLEPYFMDIVVAVLRGKIHPAQEIVVTAHLDHPKESANDNASGSGGMLDMAMSLKHLMEEGRLAAPDRTMRFLWVPEWNGTMAYIDAHPEFSGPSLGGSVLANLNLDMIGENLELVHSRMVITRTPFSTPSVLNDVVRDMATMVDRMNVRTLRGSLSAMNYRIVPYGGGSDHMMAIDRKIPGVMFGHEDYTHHTSEDTPDKVDPVELERTEILTAGAALYLANLTPAEGLGLVRLAGANAVGRLAEANRMLTARVTVAEVAGVAAAWSDAQRALDFRLDVERQALRSVLLFADDPPLRNEVTSQSSLLSALEPMLSQDLAEAARSQGAGGNKAGPAVGRTDQRVPVRLTRGPLDFGLPASKLTVVERSWYSSPAFTLNGDERFELVNFIDGKRTVTDIRNALSAEFAPRKTSEIARYIEDLVQGGVVRWR